MVKTTDNCDTKSVIARHPTIVSNLIKPVPQWKKITQELEIVEKPKKFWLRINYYRTSKSYYQIIKADKRNNCY